MSLWMPGPLQSTAGSFNLCQYHPYSSSHGFSSVHFPILTTTVKLHEDLEQHLLLIRFPIGKLLGSARDKELLMLLNSIIYRNANSQRNYSGVLFYTATFYAQSQNGEPDQAVKIRLLTWICQMIEMSAVLLNAS